MRVAAETYLAPPSSTAENLHEVALILGASAAFLVALGVLWLLVIRKWHKVSGSIDTKLGHIDLAVNGISKGEAPLIEKVRQLQRHQAWQVDVIAAIGVHLGLVLPDPPDMSAPTAPHKEAH